MIISSGQIQSLIAQYSKQDQKTPNKIKTVVPGTPQKSMDKISVSNDAQTFLAAKQAIKSVPDIRSEKVAELEQRIKSGTYHVKDEDIAEKMIGRSLVDTLV